MVICILYDFCVEMRQKLPVLTCQLAEAVLAAFPCPGKKKQCDGTRRTHKMIEIPPLE